MMQKIQADQENIFFNNGLLHIINMYRKIHHFLFKWWIFIVISLITFFVTKWIVSNYHVWYTPDYTNREEELNEEKVETISLSWMEVMTRLWYLSVDDTVLESDKNLIQYQGVILGNNTIINLQENLLDWEIFNQGESKEEDLDKLLYKLLQQGEFPQINLPYYTISNSLIQNFNLSCVWNQPFYPNICDFYFHHFLEYGIFYDIEDHIQDLNLLMLNIQKDPQKISDFCTFLLHYVETRQSWAEELWSLLFQCDKDLYDQYIVTKSLIEINNEIDEKIFNTRVFTNKYLNAYKTISLMKVLYRNFENGIYNKANITNYLDFIQLLINKDNLTNNYIDPIYKDLIYLFNKNILQVKLENNTNTFSKADINTLVNKISLLNKGDITFWNIWLEKQVKTKALVNTKDIKEIETYEVDIETLLNSIFSLKNHLKIAKYNISDDNKEVTIQTEIFFEKYPEIRLRAVLYLYLEDNTLFVKDIKIVDNEEITTYLKNLNTFERYTVPQIINVLDENILLFQITETKWEEYCKLLESTEYTLQCNWNQFLIEKEGIEYEFIIENRVLQTFSISDTSLDEEIKKHLETVIFKEGNTASLIDEILHYTNNDTEVVFEDKEVNVEALLLIKEKFKEYFLTTVKITETDDPNIFETLFTIKDITLKRIII